MVLLPMNLTKEFWEKVYRENAPKMAGICFRYVADKEIAEDLMHDAFLSAIQHQNSYTGKGCVEAWLRKIAVNKSLKYLQNRNSKKIIDDWMQNEHEYQPDDMPDSQTIRGIIEQADFIDEELLEVVELLPQHHKLVFNMYVIDHFSHIDIGRELNISPGTSKSHLARARKKIQQLLYQKAIGKSEGGKKTKRAGVILLLIPKKLHYIDRLFSGRMGNFSLNTTGNPDKIWRSINWENLSIPKFKPHSILSRTGRWLLGTSCGIIMVTIVLISFQNTKTTQLPPATSPSMLISGDTLQSMIAADSISISERSIQEEPVVIKRMIIQQKTIIIRDTINLADSTHAQ
jgi:RNA polymerase sigma factor (sigma-70 family)